MFISPMPSRTEILTKIDPETAHNLALTVLGKAQSTKFSLKLIEKLFTESGARYESERLAIQIAGINFENPLILAAGFDKNGKAVKSAIAIGFSSAVVGTVTEFEQAGNSKPRVSRLQGESLINNMGFPNLGVDRVAKNLAEYEQREFPLGVSIGVNHWVEPVDAPSSFANMTEILYNYFDFAEINISSPNTSVNLLLQNEQSIRNIILAVSERMESLGGIKPIFLKVSPDANLSQIDTAIQVAMDFGLPIVATNTTAEVAKSLGFEKGGASGAVLRAKATAVIRHINSSTNGQLEIIGAGGVKDIDSALEKFYAGAKAIQIYTGFVYPPNPSLPSRLNRELDERLIYGR